MRTLLIIFILFLTACTHQKTKKPNNIEFAKFLKNQSDQIKTVRGRVSILFKSEEGKIRIPTDVLIDRSVPTNPQVKMAAIGPFGVTYVVIVLKEGQLTWIDYEKKKVHKVENNWHGIDLNSFADLILGVTNQEPSRIQLADSPESVDQFEANHNDQVVTYELDWYDGNDLHILMPLLSHVFTNGNNARYDVRYSEYQSVLDTKLAKQIEIKAQNGFELNLTWRERSFNDSISQNYFEIPKTEF